MTLTRGEVVLIPFPYSDLSAIKARPAVVISIERFNIRGEALIGYLTSKFPSSLAEFDYALRDWQAAELLKPTLARPRIAVISHTLIQRRLGELTQHDLKAVEQRIREVLGL
jgi:mRNA interferase MazF